MKRFLKKLTHLGHASKGTDSDDLSDAIRNIAEIMNANSSARTHRTWSRIEDIAR